MKVFNQAGYMPHSNIFGHGFTSAVTDFLATLERVEHWQSKSVIRIYEIVMPMLYPYRTPLELGITLARRGSTSTAMRRARAKALKAASIMW